MRSRISATEMIDCQWCDEGSTARAALEAQGYEAMRRDERFGVRWVLMAKRVPVEPGDK